MYLSLLDLQSKWSSPDQEMELWRYIEMIMLRQLDLGADAETFEMLKTVNQSKTHCLF